MANDGRVTVGPIGSGSDFEYCDDNHAEIIIYQAMQQATEAKLPLILV